MCDTLCLLGPDRTLFAKSSDRPVGERQLLEAHPRRPAGGMLRATHVAIPDAGAHALVGSRPEWCWGLEHGVNEHRVAIGNERVWTVDDPGPVPPALIGMDLVRLGLERAASADEAIDVITDLLGRYGQGGSCDPAGDAYWSSFLIADPGGAWMLETSSRTWAARPVIRGEAISNRISLRTDWTRASADVAPGADFDVWRDPAVPTAIGDVRLAVTAPSARRGAARVTPPELAATLRDHGGRPWGAVGDDGPVVPPPAALGNDLAGLTVCMHLHDRQVTAASMIAELPGAPDEPARAWACLASPCASVFVPLFPPVEVPHRLGEPSAWDRFDHLRRRVETDPGSLDGVRAVLGPLEAELWAEARDLGPRTAAPLVAAVGDRLDAALDDLGVP